MKPNKAWFWIAVGLQLALLLVMVVPRWAVMANGKTVLLETEPYDPYDIFRGYYAVLNYKISRVENLPEEIDSHSKSSEVYYVVLSKDADGIGQPRKVTKTLPRTLGENEAVIRGRSNYGWMKYGIESYYLPENRRREIEELLAGGKQRALVEVKVNDAGEAVIVSLRVGGRRFTY